MMYMVSSNSGWFQMEKLLSIHYIRSVLGKDLPKVAVEAGIRQGWDALIGRDGTFIGMDGFGASAPGAQLFEHFGITADAVYDAAKAALAP